MKQAALTNPTFLNDLIRTYHVQYVLVFFAGLIGPLGFAPFHMPGLTLLSLSFLFSQLLNASVKTGALLGFIFGLGYFGLGVSWVIISIHDYGEINYCFAALITLLFIMYLALFPTLVAYLFNILKTNRSALGLMVLFSILWCLSEILRSHLLTGFPWLLIGTSQIDTPLRFLAPIIGIYGLSLLCAFCATLLAFAVSELRLKRYYYLVAFIIILISPSLLQSIEWTKVNKEPISIGAVQANLSMRDKWDETLFWNLLKYYEKATDKLMGKQLIILPESAIPLPAHYLEAYLDRLNNKALKANSAIILGILQPANDNETNFYNSIISLGHAKGIHNKYQLVPFGEYIPKPFETINRWLNLPELNILPGKYSQRLIKIFNHPIASLICYEIAYPNLLRQQLPKAQWIVSISDNGWFGQSLASYQQLQMSQMLSLLTGRYQVIVNNDGLSSVINPAGHIVNGLQPFSSGILQSEVFEASGATPWVLWGDYPIFIFCFICFVFTQNYRLRQLFNK
jgi:apolipoprotein N-acyltransferase